MSQIGRVVGLFATKPRHPVGSDGRMALSDHFRELRGRLMRSLAILLVGLTIALFFFDPLLVFVFEPYAEAMRRLDQDIDSIPSIGGIGGPLLLYLKLCGLAALIGTAPLWLYQIWAFILPGLHAHERKWSRVFAIVAGPLFLLGVAIGYLTLPKGVEVLVGFTPSQLTSIVDFGGYLSFFTRTLLVFGLAFEIPVFVILLNLAGVVTGKALGAYRPWIIMGTFIFAAVATPSTDPFTMLFLAVPMVALFLVSEIIARIVDRRRRRNLETSALDDDVASPL
ncbi:MAG: twin-arginine translocase subunit TatC [Nocardioides sp.]